MATKNGTQVGDFYVTSWCRRAGSRVKKITLGATDVEHVLSFENGSTLPYDVQSTTILPDAPPHDSTGTVEIEFSYGGGARQTSWNAFISQIASGETEKDAATIHCVTTNETEVRIHTTQVEYRLDSTDQWDTEAGADLPLEIKMPVKN
jgi:hypothetical protein